MRMRILQYTLLAFFLQHSLFSTMALAKQGRHPVGKTAESHSPFHERKKSQRKTANSSGKKSERSGGCYLYRRSRSKCMLASWYGPGFHGKKTASGERFNMYSLTTAHKYFPLNTLLRVRNQATGKSVVVRVNDRGPYKKSRELDLSKAAAERLGMRKKGVAYLTVTVISRPRKSSNT